MPKNYYAVSIYTADMLTKETWDRWRLNVAREYRKKLSRKRWRNMRALLRRHWRKEVEPRLKNPLHGVYLAV